MEFDAIKELFQRFNRKERYHLIHYACGGFQMSSDFKKKVEQALNIKFAANKTWMAMDYHLDWLSAIIRLLKEETPSGREIEEWLGSIQNKKRENYLPGQKKTIENQVLEGNQQDVDLLILGQDAEENVIHMIMVEAKLDSAWTNKQVATKGARMSAVLSYESGEITLPDTASGSEKMKLHLLLMDPRKELTKNLKHENLPNWACKKKPPHMRLPLATGEAGWPLYRPVRTIKKAKGHYAKWQIAPVDSRG